MEINFKLEQEAAVALVNVLGQLPTNSGVFPLLTNLVAQYNEQTQVEKPAE